MDRKKVYEMIDGERAYQDSRWTIESGARVIHSPEEWLVYMEDYINEAKHIMSREAYGICERKAMNIIRKVAAMAVCAIEQNDCDPR